MSVGYLWFVKRPWTTSSSGFVVISFNYLPFIRCTLSYLFGVAVHFNSVCRRSQGLLFAIGSHTHVCCMTSLRMYEFMYVCPGISSTQVHACRQLMLQLHSTNASARLNVKQLSTHMYYTAVSFSLSTLLALELHSTYLLRCVVWPFKVVRKAKSRLAEILQEALPYLPYHVVCQITRLACTWDS